MYSLTALVHGRSKVGKSTLGSTSPKPVLIIDAEGSSKMLPLRMVRWNPVTHAPPEYKNDWDAAVIQLNTFDQLNSVSTWLASGQHPFVSLVVDSATEIQRKLKDQVTGGEKANWDSWDEILRRMDILLRSFRDLTQHETNPLQTVLFICETSEKDGFYRPKMRGSIRDDIPYLFDIEGWIWLEGLVGSDGQPALDENGKQRKISRLLLDASNPIYEAGERVQGRLPDVIDNPNITEMLHTVFPNLKGD